LHAAHASVNDTLAQVADVASATDTPTQPSEPRDGQA
jgi:hypothetical protein